MHCLFGFTAPATLPAQGKCQGETWVSMSRAPEAISSRRCGSSQASTNQLLLVSAILHSAYVLARMQDTSLCPFRTVALTMAWLALCWLFKTLDQLARTKHPQHQAWCRLASKIYTYECTLHSPSDVHTYPVAERPCSEFVYLGCTTFRLPLSKLYAC